MASNSQVLLVVQPTPLLPKDLARQCALLLSQSRLLNLRHKHLYKKVPPLDQRLLLLRPAVKGVAKNLCPSISEGIVCLVTR